MGRYRYGAALAVLLASGALAATQGPPVYVYTGTAPSGACAGDRVWIDALGTGTYYCNAGTWTAAPSGGTVPVTQGGTGNTTIAANQVFLGTSTDTLTAKSIPSCSGATTDKLLYDVGTSAFTCGTDQGGVARTSTTSLWSNNTTGYQNILTNSGLSTGTIYLIRCTLVHRTSTATTAVRIRFNSTGTMTWMSVMTELPSSASAMLYQHHTALATAGTAANSVITNVVGRIDGIFATNTATDISIEGAAETTGTVYVDRATCTVEPL